MWATRGLALLLVLRLTKDVAAFAFPTASLGMPRLIPLALSKLAHGRANAQVAQHHSTSALLLALGLPRATATRCSAAKDGTNAAPPSTEPLLHMNETALELQREIEAVMTQRAWPAASQSITRVLSRLQALRSRVDWSASPPPSAGGEAGEVYALLGNIEAAARGASKLVQATASSDAAWSEMVEELGQALTHFSVRLAPGHFFLGMGAARVFKVVRGDPERSVAVLKLYPWQQGSWGEDEVQTLQRLEADNVLPKGRVLGHTSLPAFGGYALLTSNVGVPLVEPCSEADIDGMFVALSQMHRQGWSHGDARVPNFIVVDGVVEPIDFEMSLGKGAASESEMTEDMWRLASSVFGISGTLNLFNNPRDVIVDALDAKGLGREVSLSLEKAIQAYTRGGYQEKDAKAIAGIVFLGMAPKS